MRKEIEIQQENIQKLMKLAKENPDLRILPMVEVECVPSDDFGWWVAQFGKVSIDEVYVIDERIYIRSEDEEELVDSVAENKDWDKSLPDDEIYKKSEEVVANYDWEKVILVEINPN